MYQSLSYVVNMVWVTQPFINGALNASLMTRMEELEDENRRLKKMYAEERLKSEVIQEAMAKKW
ncbi:putative orphan protein [Pseudoalteromonas translucida]|uniref:Orphan protein n=1 Tax=Pseudoalteromonas translucida (strain TAC 125) TaxID=326442 RepID=Q3IIG6_PSET1|nr:putative orphan protein [Pseudoalteromonas translucida]